MLPSKYGKYLSTKVGGFKRNINRIPTQGAKTWHFYFKDGSWKAALQFTPVEIERHSNLLSYGCIGIDINPGSIDWAKVDRSGNLKSHGKFILVLSQSIDDRLLEYNLDEIKSPKIDAQEVYC